MTRSKWQELESPGEVRAPCGCDLNSESTFHHSKGTEPHRKGEPDEGLNLAGEKATIRAGVQHCGPLTAKRGTN
ncbi:uncharacterized protein An16g08770 [Aspergillus niger]|uniref:Contig An16c0290, genomic contig n=2 Tax=Aspergillus niger TaxID=5061 RepID=A2R8Y3_ASPNC|nr:uncharacterized protein An16g08770 [Aspergillus niger]CAK42976.1 unnamed protein product [Aspergillus niger]